MRTRIRNVERWKDRHGKIRLYFRRGKGSRTPLRGPEGSPDFWADYHKAAEPGAAQVLTGKGTLQWLIGQYYQSAEFRELAKSTQKTRRRILTNFCDKNGHRQYSHLMPKHLRKIRNAMIDRPEAANGLLKVLRQLFNFAVEYDLAETNPVIGVKKLKPKNKTGYHTWTLSEIDKYEQTHPVGTKARLALALILYTGQRRGDVIRFGRQMVQDEWLYIRQEKTGKEIEIPVLSKLRRVIDASPTGDLTFLVTAYDKPFTAAGFGNRFREWCNEAELPHCSSHGLRKAISARLADEGCTTHEIAAITGHETLQEVERYTKGANQRQLAKQAFRKLEG